MCSWEGSSVYPGPTSGRQQGRCLLQGHLSGGPSRVEIATCAHRNLLRDGGLLASDQELRANGPFPVGRLLQGLVIDDFYCISLEAESTPAEASESVAALRRATSIYDEHGLLGSTEKDVVGSDRAKVAGAELDSSRPVRQLGLVTAGAPKEKRLSLASFSLSLAALPSTSDSLHTCLLGGWVSSFFTDGRSWPSSPRPSASYQGACLTLQIPG